VEAAGDVDGEDMDGEGEDGEEDGAAEAVGDVDGEAMEVMEGGSIKNLPTKSDSH
jgi:hypothetical protein